jgi:hypothetical protein
MISFKNFKKFFFTFYNILKIFIITSIKKKKNNSLKFFFFYFPVKAYQENILELGEFIAKSKNFEVYYIYNSNTKIELRLKKNSLYLDFNYIRFIPFGNFFLNKINFLISSYVIYTFPPKSKNIYICHDIYDAPMAKKYIEKRIFIELAKLDYIFVSSDIVKNYFEKGFSKNIMNKSKRKVQIVNTGYLKLDHVHKKINLRKVKEDSILIAPTSSKFYSEANLSKKLDKMINLLLEEKYKIIYRPHPMDLTIKGGIDLTNLIIEKFKDFPNFEFDISTSYIESYRKSKFLITDFSGTAYTYAFSTEKPVIFYSSLDKLSFINEINSMYYFKDRKEVGYVMTNIKDLLKKVREIDKKKIILKAKIKNLRKRRIKYFNKSLITTKKTIQRFYNF